jgi:hypothetical protein
VWGVVPPHARAALSHPGRLQLLTEVRRREDDGDDCTISGVAAATGLEVRVLIRHAVALAEAGVLTIREQRLASRLPLLAETADHLAADPPVAQLLEHQPDLRRFFSYGRLRALPTGGRNDDRQRVAALVVQLVPPGRTLSEAEINAVLGSVMDDYAELRRFLVDEGFLVRSASADYRRPS